MRSQQPSDKVTEREATERIMHDIYAGRTNQNLRKRAEEKVRADDTVSAETLSTEATEQLLHELRVHQIELEMQNEELRRTQQDLATTKARYFELYDLAPVGYLTLNAQGMIQEANLTATTLFGYARKRLIGKPLTQFISRKIRTAIICNARS